MKIEATCDTCDRTFLLSQIGPDSDAPGRCPFCGARFGRHYTTVLPVAVEDAEDAVTAFLNMLARVRSLETGFQIDVDGLLAALANEVREADRQRAAG